MSSNDRFAGTMKLTIKAYRILIGLCVWLGVVRMVNGQDAQQIIDLASKVYSEATAYSAGVDSRTLQFVFAPTPEGQPQRYSIISEQYRRMQLRVKRPDGYYLGIQIYRVPTLGGAHESIFFLARRDSGLSKQGVSIDGHFSLMDLPAEQFNGMAHSRMGSFAGRDLVLRHFRALPEVSSGNIPLGLLNPEVIGREVGDSPTYRLIANTVEGYPVMLWIEQGTYKILHTIVQCPLGPVFGSEDNQPVRASRRTMSVVVETFYNGQLINPPLTDNSFVINPPPSNEQPDWGKLGFCSVDALVKLAEIAPVAGDELAAQSILNDDSDKVPVMVEQSTLKPSNGGQALTQSQMEGIVLIEGEDSTATGFMTKIRDVDFIVTNQHVLGSGKKLKFKTLRGEEIATTGIYGAVGSDIAIIRIDRTLGDLALVKDVFSGCKIGDKVVVVGNRLGGGVATQTTGNVMGIGPTRIEVNANFEPGNSGSPIVNLDTGEVVGVATYSETRRISVDEAGSTSTSGAGNTGQVEKRWFGYRIDSVKKWEAIDLVQWGEQRARIDKFYETSRALNAVVRFEFKTARQHPRLTALFDQFDSRYQSSANNAITSATAVKDLFYVIRTISEDGVRDLETGPYYDYFRSSLYWETSIPAQLEYRKAINAVLRKYEANSSQFMSRMRNGG